MKANSSEEASKWAEQLKKMITQKIQDELAMGQARQEAEIARLEEANEAARIQQAELQEDFKSIENPVEMENFLISNDNQDSDIISE